MQNMVRFENIYIIFVSKILFEISLNFVFSRPPGAKNTQHFVFSRPPGVFSRPPGAKNHKLSYFVALRGQKSLNFVFSRPPGEKVH